MFNMGHKKARESVLVTRPTYQGSCIAQLSRSSNAEAHAEYVYFITANTAMANVHIPLRTSTVALIRDNFLNLQDSDTSRTKRKVNALLCHVFPAMHPPPFVRRTSAKEQLQKYYFFFK